MKQRELIDATDDEVLASGPSEISVDKARELVATYEKVTTSKNVVAFLSGFTDDCIVQYGQFPIMRGKDELLPFVERMFAPNLHDFVCRKSLRCLSGNVIGGTWTAEWNDPKSQTKMAGRGFEFWIMRGEQIARWDAAFNSWAIGECRQRVAGGTSILARIRHIWGFSPSSA